MKQFVDIWAIGCLLVAANEIKLSVSVPGQAQPTSVIDQL